MSFCEVQDIIDRLSATGILYAVDDDNDGTREASEEAYLQDAIDFAESTEINPTLLTITETPSIYEGNDTLKWWTVDIASERVAQRKGQTAPESLTQAAQRARDFLTLFREGKYMIPGIKPPAVQRDIEFRNLGRPRIARR